jgi:hypothetical protein
MLRYEQDEPHDVVVGLGAPTGAGVDKLDATGRTEGTLGAVRCVSPATTRTPTGADSRPTISLRWACSATLATVTTTGRGATACRAERATRDSTGRSIGSRATGRSATRATVGKAGVVGTATTVVKNRPERIRYQAPATSGRIGVGTLARISLNQRTTVAGE